MLVSDDPNDDPRFEVRPSAIEENWPADLSVAVCLTFDTQGAIDGLQEGSHYQNTTRWPNGEPNWWDYSERQYGISAGLPRILDVLAEYDVSATFPTCGLTAAWYPDAVAEIAELGHEIANHSHSHRLHFKLDAAEERAEIETAADAIEDATGRRPVGWRSPAFSLTETTVAELAAQGYLWDSSLHDRDLPYVLTDGEVEILELPAGHLDDWTMYLVGTSANVGHMGGYPVGTPEGVLSQLTAAFDQFYREAEAGNPRVFTCTMHPKITGRPHRTWALARFIEHAAEHPGVQFLTCGELAELATR